MEEGRVEAEVRSRKKYLALSMGGRYNRSKYEKNTELAKTNHGLGGDLRSVPIYAVHMDRLIL